jgi:hypothetical protein
VIVESYQEEDVCLLKAKLDTENIPAIAEIYSRIPGHGALLPFRNQLLIKPESETKTRQIFKKAGMEEFLV